MSPGCTTAAEAVARAPTAASPLHLPCLQKQLTEIVVVVVVVVAIDVAVGFVVVVVVVAIDDAIDFVVVVVVAAAVVVVVVYVRHAESTAAVIRCPPQSQEVREG